MKKKIIKDGITQILKLVGKCVLPFLLRIIPPIAYCVKRKLFKRDIKHKIALMCFGGIGDVILFFPVIRIIRERYPDAELTVFLLSRSTSALSLIEGVDSTFSLSQSWHGRLRFLANFLNVKYDSILFSTTHDVSSMLLSLCFALSTASTIIGLQKKQKTERFYLLNSVYNSHLNVEDNIYRGLLNFQLAKAYLTLKDNTLSSLENLSQVDYSIPKINIHRDEKSALTDKLGHLFSHAGEKRYILIHPGVSKLSKQQNKIKTWPTPYWYEVIQNLISADDQIHILMAGGPDDTEELNELRTFSSKLLSNQQERIFDVSQKINSLREFAVLVSLSNLFIGFDSAAAHIAVAVNTPSVVIFTLSNEKSYFAEGSQFLIALREDLPCRPCLGITRYNSCEQPDCIFVPPSIVLNKALSLIGSSELLR